MKNPGLKDLLKQVYGNYDPNQVPDDAQLDSLLTEFKGNETKLLRSLYDHYDPEHGLGDTDFESMIGEFSEKKNLGETGQRDQSATQPIGSSDPNIPVRDVGTSTDEPFTGPIDGEATRFELWDQMVASDNPDEIRQLTEVYNNQLAKKKTAKQDAWRRIEEAESDIDRDFAIQDYNKEAELERLHEVQKLRISRTPNEIKADIVNYNSAESQLLEQRNKLLKTNGDDFFERFESLKADVDRINALPAEEKALAESELEQKSRELERMANSEDLQKYLQANENLKAASERYNQGFAEFEQSVKDEDDNIRAEWRSKYGSEFMGNIYSSISQGVGKMYADAAGLPRFIHDLVFEKTDGSKLESPWFDSLAKWGEDLQKDIEGYHKVPLAASGRLFEQADNVVGYKVNPEAATHKITKTATELIGTMLGTKGLSSAGVGTKLAVGSTVMAQSYREGISMAKEIGMNNQEADRFGLLYGAAIGGVSMIFPGVESALNSGMREGLKKIAIGSSGSKVGAIFSEAFKEGIEESVLETMSTETLKLAYNQLGSKQFDLIDWKSADEINNRVEEFTIGFLLGGGVKTLQPVAQGNGFVQETLFSAIQDTDKAFEILDNLPDKVFATESREQLKDRIGTLAKQVANSELRDPREKMKLMLLQDAHNEIQKRSKDVIDEGLKERSKRSMAALSEEIKKMTAPELIEAPKEGETVKEAVVPEEVKGIIENANKLTVAPAPVPVEEENVPSDTQNVPIDGQSEAESENQETIDNQEEQTIEQEEESSSGEDTVPIQPEGEPGVVDPEMDEANQRLKEEYEQYTDQQLQETLLSIDFADNPTDLENRQRDIIKQIMDERAINENPFGEETTELKRKSPKEVEEYASGVESGRRAVKAGLTFAQELAGAYTPQQAIAEQLMRKDQFNLEDVVKQTGLSESEVKKLNRGIGKDGALLEDIAEEISQQFDGIISPEDVMDELITGLGSGKSNKQIVGDLIRSFAMPDVDQAAAEEFIANNQERIGQIEEQYYLGDEGIDYKGIVNDSEALGLSPEEDYYFRNKLQNFYKERYGQKQRKNEVDLDKAIGFDNATAIEIDELYDLRALDPKAVQTLEEYQQRAIAEGWHLQDYASALAQRVIVASQSKTASGRKGMAISPEESIGLQMYLVALKGEIDSLYSDRKGFAPGMTEEIDRRIEAKSDLLREAVLARSLANSQFGTNLGILSRYMDPEDFSITSLMQLAEQQKFRDTEEFFGGAIKREFDQIALTETEQEALIGLSEKIAEAQKQFEEIQARIQKLENEEMKADAEAELARILKVNANVRRAVKKNAKREAKKQELFDRLKALTKQANDITQLSTEIPSIVYELTKIYVAEGITSMSEITKKIQEQIPAATQNDVYVGLYSRGRKAAKKVETQAADHIKNLSKEAELLLKIEKALAGLDPNNLSKEYGFFVKNKKLKYSDKVEALQAQLDAILESEAETQFEQKKLKEIQEKILEVQGHLAKGTFPAAKKQKESIQSQSIKDAKAELADLKKLLSLKQRKAKYEDMVAKLKAGDTSVLEKAPPQLKVAHSPEMQAEWNKAAYELAKAKQEAKRYIQGLEPKDSWDKLGEAYNVIRTLKATMDLSGTFRQGLYLAMLDPMAAANAFQQAWKIALPKMLGGLEGDAMAHAEALYQQIIAMPNQKARMEAKLELTEPDAIVRSEELYQSRWIKNFTNNIAGRLFSRGVKGSEAHMVSYLNLLRVSAFDSFMKNHPDASKEDLMEYARWVNILSGRGQIPKNINLQVIANIAFAPKYTVSRFQMLGQMTGVNAYKGFMAVTGKESLSTARKKIMFETVRIGATVAGIIGVALALGYDFETDPRSSDFLKLVGDNDRTDFLAGEAQTLRVIAQMGIKVLEAQGMEQSDNPNHKSFNNPNKGPLAIATNFLWLKAHPTISVLASAAMKEDPIGRPMFNPDYMYMDWVDNVFFPITVPEAYEQYKSHNAAEATAHTIMNIVGLPVSTYDDPANSQQAKEFWEKIDYKPSITYSDRAEFISKDRFMKDEFRSDFYTKLMEEIMNKSYFQNPNQYTKAEVRSLAKQIRVELESEYIKMHPAKKKAYDQEQREKKD